MPGVNACHLGRRFEAAAGGCGRAGHPFTLARWDHCLRPAPVMTTEWRRFVAEPWQCPQCRTWIRGDVTEHRCPPDDAVPAVTGTGGAGGPHPAAVVTVTGAPHHLWASTGSSATMPGVAVNIPATTMGSSEAESLMRMVSGGLSINTARRHLGLTPLEMDDFPAT